MEEINKRNKWKLVTPFYLVDCVFNHTSRNYEADGKAFYDDNDKTVLHYLEKIKVTYAKKLDTTIEDRQDLWIMGYFNTEEDMNKYKRFFDFQVDNYIKYMKRRGFDCVEQQDWTSLRLEKLNKSSDKKFIGVTLFNPYQPNIMVRRSKYLVNLM